MAGRKINLRVDGKTLATGLEWGREQASPAIVLISSDRLPEEWAEFAEAVSQEHRVIAIGREAVASLRAVLKSAGGAPVLVAHGPAGRQACSTAAADPDALLALVLADYRPEAGWTEHTRVSVPAMVLRGRQSRLLPHADAVALHGAMPASRLIEPEDCGDWPFGSCPEVCAIAVKWFVSELSSPVMHFAVEGEGDPVDPRPEG